jgi:EasF-like predicted methyltransferase
MDEVNRNMKKTVLILQALQSQQKHVHYIACDVDAVGLRRYLQELQIIFPAATSTIRIQGLIGTYEDYAAWLKYNTNPKNCYTFLMWLGNSIANFTPQEASDYIRNFLGEGSSMIVGIDGCKNQQEIALSYEGECNRKFILNGLLHANQLLGTKAFDIDDWEIVGRWNAEVWMHESFYVARKDLAVNLGDEKFCFRKGDRMMSIRSGKWPKKKVVEICGNAGGRVAENWMNSNKSYGELIPTHFCSILII